MENNEEENDRPIRKDENEINSHDLHMYRNIRHQTEKVFTNKL